ncbi:MAG TPA: hypothetical protein VGK80_03085 [Rhodanobacteraceae bacterium]
MSIERAPRGARFVLEVIPEQAGIQLLYRPKLRYRAWCFDIHVFFRSPPGRAGYFCFGKISQNHCAGMTVSPTSGWLDCPALLAGRAPARTRTSCARTSRLSRAPGCDARRHATALKARSIRPSMACDLGGRSSREICAQELHKINADF